ncbi:NADH-ubiquinone oxidoreductase-F iron-sulfur binding region domain-containing protein [Haloterrigena salifodinae]|uniref:NADH-ubiquinone oxidoreductase-F iron-sulfur binding region domain-containing protein n=1 Tax=Haloterrigena salifodinae TaxID=2675099 RepID=UPI000F893A8C|nr:NADH-ubiquinone oxidoreductase-F iron-sulfur binding region domain-containing protein [Haloterrigena salifodinae]
MTAITTGDHLVIRVAAGDPDRDPSLSTAGFDGPIVNVGPTGVPALEPLIAVTAAGRTALYTHCSTADLESITASVEETGDVDGADPDAVVSHAPDRNRLPTAPLPGLRAGDRRVLGACSWRRPTSVADHKAAGGFAPSDAETVLTVGNSLNGRGWGDLCQDDPLAETWRTARATDGDPVVVVNGHGSPADTLLLSSAPFEVLDGASVLASTVAADRIIVYASSEDDNAVKTVSSAVDTYPDPAAPMEVVTGPEEYRAAEPTMAIEAIEGNHRLEARLRPPGPERVGLDGRPTLVHTPRTLAHLAVGLREGIDEQTRVMTVRGDVDSVATVELSETQKLSELVDTVGVDGSFKAACVGGRFGGITRDLDVGIGVEALNNADLGTDGIVDVLSDARCLVEFVGQRASFAAEENCGRCVPCREGTAQLASLLRNVYDGEFDAQAIAELDRVMASSSICVFGERAGRPVRTAIEAFTSEFKAHAEGRCPAGTCLEPLEA